MKILIVSATLFEVEHLVERNPLTQLIPDHLYRFQANRAEVHLLTTGIGLLPTAFYLGRRLHGESYDMAFNVGICGSYLPEIPLGTVLHVTEEKLPESGIEENGRFTSLVDLGLISGDEYPYEEGVLTNTLIPELNTISLLQPVSGNTVSTLLTTRAQIAHLTAHSPAEVESMEGAAFLFACLVEKIPCAQIRAVSNYVGERDKKKWDIRLALKNLNSVVQKLLEEITS